MERMAFVQRNLTRFAVGDHPHREVAPAPLIPAVELEHRESKGRAVMSNPGAKVAVADPNTIPE